MIKILREDMRTILASDPAARNMLEVFFCYPGLHAVWSHRVAHFLWDHHLKFLARFLSHINRFVTGIEIHPGAKIGRRLFIDHGTGVVIGETAEIGNDVVIYQGVALAMSGAVRDNVKRHPTVGNNVVMGSGSIAIGPITIGDGARVGAGSVVIKPVDPGAVVVGVPGRSVKEQQNPLLTLQSGKLPDPIAEAISVILKEQDQLLERLRKLERASGAVIEDEAFEEQREIIKQSFDGGEGI